MTSVPSAPDRQPGGGRPTRVLLADDHTLVRRGVRLILDGEPDLSVVAEAGDGAEAVARARDTAHAAELYKAGATDAVPETLESSLQLAEAALFDLGVPMGLVIASIHEKRAQLRAQIMGEAEMASEPRLGGKRLRDAGPA